MKRKIRSFHCFYSSSESYCLSLKESLNILFQSDTSTGFFVCGFGFTTALAVRVTFGFTGGLGFIADFGFAVALGFAVVLCLATKSLFEPLNDSVLAATFFTGLRGDGTQSSSSSLLTRLTIKLYKPLKAEITSVPAMPTIPNTIEKTSLTFSPKCFSRINFKA